MEDKCFCHFNGFRVKDAEARARIEVLEQNAGSGGSSDTIHVDMPLGLVPIGQDIVYNHELDSECVNILNDLIKNELKDKDLSKINVIIHNTTESVEVEGVTVENPSPRRLIFTNISKTEPYTDEFEQDIAGNYSFVGYSETDETHITDMNIVDCDEYHLDVNFGYLIDKPEEIECIKGVLSSIKYSLPTTKYLEENAGEGSDGSLSDTIVIKLNTQLTNDATYGLTDAEKTEINEKFNEFYTSTGRYPRILFDDNKGKHFMFEVYLVTNTKIQYVSVKTYYDLFYQKSVKYTNKQYAANVTYDSNEDKYKFSNGTIYSLTEEYLSRTNTESYTPTSDYHPATKKYVDDKYKTLTSSGDTIVTHSSFSRLFQYPSGYTKDNCCVVSVMYKTDVTSMHYDTTIGVNLGDNDITVVITDLVSTASTVDIKLVLTKI